MPTVSIPQDKPKLMFYAAMMWVQNFGFFVMYFMLYQHIPDPSTGDCDNLRFWVGFFALDCFVESFVCIWMAMGGYTDDNLLFPLMWILHLIVALPYCICTYTIPHAIYSDEGKSCRVTAGAPLLPLVPVYWTHAALFLVYVWMMLAVTYFSWAKPTFFAQQGYRNVGG
mmetsp:Transcript_122886/g.274491  ORF Transcript_122886/g.274491 Transcript_122886/m.274491 type:complete len:169 (-) Transcript_122886:91-597(-)